MQNRAPDEFSFQQIRAFREIARTGSFSKAAEAMDLSQPTVSQHLQKLEEILGSMLIDRSSRKARLTNAGKLFLAYADQLSVLRDKAALAVTSLAGSVTGTLRIGGSTIPGNYLVPRVLPEFCAKYPGLGVTLEVSDSGEVVKRLKAGEIDVGVIGSEIDDPRMSLTRFASDRIVLVSGLDHRLASRQAVSLRELLKESIVHREAGSGSRREFEKALGKAGINPSDLSVACVVGSTEAAKQAVMHGPCISYVSERSISGNPRLDRLRILDFKGLDIRRSCFVAVPKGRADSSPAAVFARFLQEQAF